MGLAQLNSPFELIVQALARTKVRFVTGQPHVPADGADLWVTKPLNKDPQGFRTKHDVGIAEADYRPVCRRDSIVDDRGLSTPLGKVQQTYASLGVGSSDLGRPVGATVTGHEDFELFGRIVNGQHVFQLFV